MSSNRILFRFVLAPLLLLILVAGGVYLQLHRSTPDPVSRAPKKAPVTSSYLLPSWLDAARQKSAIEHIRRIETAGGAAPNDVAALGRLLPAQPKKRVEWLERIRTYLDLAVRSKSVAAAGAALQILRVAAHGRVRLTMEALTSPPFRELVAHAVESPVAGIRIEAARFLPYLGGPRSRIEATRLLADPDPRVRAQAAEAYGRLASRAGAKRLAALYEEEKSAAVRTAILAALGRRAELRGPAAFATEKRALEHGTTAEKLQVLDNIDLYRDHDDLAQILPLLGAPVAELRRAALRTIRILRDPRARAAVEKRARVEPDPSIRKLAEETARELR